MTPVAPPHVNGPQSFLQHFKKSRRVCFAPTGYCLLLLPHVPVLSVEKLFPDMPTDHQTALWKSKEAVYRVISTEMTPLPGLLAFLERCQVAGLDMIIVTNAPRIDAIHTLKVLGLYERQGSFHSKTWLVCC